MRCIYVMCNYIMYVLQHLDPYRGEFHCSTDSDRELTEVMTRAGFIVELCEHYNCCYEVDVGYNVFGKYHTSLCDLYFSLSI